MTTASHPTPQHITLLVHPLARHARPAPLYSRESRHATRARPTPHTRRGMRRMRQPLHANQAGYCRQAGRFCPQALQGRIGGAAGRVGRDRRRAWPPMGSLARAGRQAVSEASSTGGCAHTGLTETRHALVLSGSVGRAGRRTTAGSAPDGRAPRLCQRYASDAPGRCIR
jgi:hypothetical protein